MAAYEFPVRDFMDRTMENLALVDEHELHPGVWEVTQLVNSVLGALAHPWEQWKAELCQMTLDEARARGFPIPEKSDSRDKEPKSFGDLLRLLRNSIAQGNIIFVNDHNCYKRKSTYNISYGYLLMPNENGENMISEVLQPSVFDRKINRRDVLKGAIGVVAGAMLAEHSRAASTAPVNNAENLRSLGLNNASGIEIAENPASAVLVETPNLSLPVPEKERDVRTKSFNPTLIVVDESMQVRPPGVRVKSIGYNTEYTQQEAENRINLASAAALIQAYDVSQKHLDGENYSKLEASLQKGEVPEAPAWADYLNRLTNKEKFMLPLMALPANAPAEIGELKWMKVDITKGMKLNHTADAQLIHQQYVKGTPADGWSFRVNEDNELQIDIYNNNTLTNEHENFEQITYDYMFSATVARAYGSLATTLGIFDEDGSLFQKYALAPAYEDILTENLWASVFPSQNELLIGGKPEEGYPDKLFSVNLQK